MNEQEQTRIFDTWISEHQGLMFKVIRAYAFNPHDQEDLFQDMAIRIWKSIPAFRGESSVSTWLYRVALFSAIAWSKRERSHRTRTEPIQLEHQQIGIATPPKDPRLEWLYEQLKRLDEIDRSVTLLMLEGWSYLEIAEALGISASNVGVKLNRIKKQLSTIPYEG
ncbi:MAG: sigma-70 family RNA polymerase sigma factor [Pirellulaceae bacterium]